MAGGEGSGDRGRGVGGEGARGQGVSEGWWEVSGRQGVWCGRGWGQQVAES